MNIRFLTLLVIILIAASGAVAAAPPEDAGQRLKSFRTQVKNIDRSYHLFVPANYNPAKAAPLVFVLHGGGGSGEKMFESSDMHEIAERENFLVVYPDGATRGEDGMDTWDIGRADEADNGEAEPWDDISFMRKIIAETGDRYSIDPARIYATGISRGGMFSYRIACEMADVVAAIAPIAGAMEMDTRLCNPAASVPVMHIHGTEEENVPFGGGSGRLTKNEWSPVMPGLAFWKAHNRCSNDKTVTYDADDTTCVTYRDCSPVGATSLCLVGRHGHGWPGRPPMRWHQESGVPINEDFKASEMIWAFFKKNQKEAPQPITVSGPVNRSATGAAYHR